MRQSLGDQHPALHPAGQGHDALVALVPQAERPQDFLDPVPVGGKPEQAARIAYRAMDGFEHVGAEFLGNQADTTACAAPVGRQIVPESANTSRSRAHEPAYCADQRGLACPVRPEQCEDLALVDGKIDIVERGQPAGIDLRQAGEFENRLHIS